MTTYRRNSLLRPEFRSLNDSERMGFQGVEDDENEAQVAELRVDGHDALLILDDNGFEIHIDGPDGATTCYAAKTECDNPATHAALALLANYVFQRANGGNLGIASRDLRDLGLDAIN